MSQATLRCPGPGTTEVIKRYWFGFDWELPHLCRTPEPTTAVGKAALRQISSRKQVVFTGPSSASPEHSDYLLIVFKKGQVAVQCPQHAAMQLEYKSQPIWGLSSVRDVHAPLLLFPQISCFIPPCNARTMLNLIPLTVFSSSSYLGKWLWDGQD